jgi:hypothetical protein
MRELRMNFDATLPMPTKDASACNCDRALFQSRMPEQEQAAPWGGLFGKAGTFLLREPD